MLQEPGLRVQVDQTTLIRDTLDAAAGIEDALCQRHWALCVAPIDRQFVASDDPVVLDFQPGIKGHFLKSPGLGRVDTIVSFVLGPRHLIMGYAFEPAVRRRDFNRENVALYNTRAVWNAAPTSSRHRRRARLLDEHRHESGRSRWSCPAPVDT